MPRVEGVVRATGRGRDEWFRLLDEWGAPGRPYREISDWLTGEHELSRWWAQKLIVEYEQDRGLRRPGIRPDGTFSVTAGKTIAAPVDRVYASIVDGRRRRGWLTDGGMALRTSTENRSARFDWEDGPSRVSIELADKDGSRTAVGVTHEKLSTAGEAAAMKAMWKERLTDLKATLER